MRQAGVRAAAPSLDPATPEGRIGAHAQSAGTVVRAYDRMAPLYDRLFGRVLEPGRQAMAAAAAQLKPRRLLEVGVGTGLTLAAYPAESSVVGIDVSAEMLDRARHRAARLPDRDITLQVMDAEHMAFEDGRFDCVAVPYVLSVTPRPGRLVQEIRRVCKPGGTILVVNHFSGSRFWWAMERAVRSVADHIGFRSEFRYEEHILGHDWNVASVRPVNLFGLSRLVVLENTASPREPASAGPGGA